MKSKKNRQGVVNTNCCDGVDVQIRNSKAVGMRPSVLSKTTYTWSNRYEYPQPQLFETTRNRCPFPLDIC